MERDLSTIINVCSLSIYLNIPDKLKPLIYILKDVKVRGQPQCIADQDTQNIRFLAGWDVQILFTPQCDQCITR